MPNYSFTEKDKRYLTLEINGKDYDLPLAGSMKVKELRKLIHIGKLPEEEQFDLQIDFLGKHLGTELVEEMTQDDITEIYQLWIKASNGQLKEDSGRTLGESSASSD
jgi:hypothetical protein